MLVYSTVASKHTNMCIRGLLLHSTAFLLLHANTLLLLNAHIYVLHTSKCPVISIVSQHLRSVQPQPQMEQHQIKQPLLIPVA